jgi:hypothetical protein
MAVSPPPRAFRELRDRTTLLAVPHSSRTVRTGVNEQRPLTTTAGSGIPVASNERSPTVGPGGATVLHDSYVVL